MYHPAFILREWSEREVAVLCLERAKEELDYWRSNGKLQPLPERQLIVQPGADEVCDFLRSCLAQPGSVSNDIETIGGKYPYTFGIASSPKLAMSFSLWDYEVQHLAKIWQLLDKVLRTKRQLARTISALTASTWKSRFRPLPDLYQIAWFATIHSGQNLSINFSFKPFNTHGTLL